MALKSARAPQCARDRVARFCALPGRSGPRLAARHGPPLIRHGVAVLKSPQQAGSEDGAELAKLDRARKALMEALLGPSLRDIREGPAPPAHIEAAPAGAAYLFSYGEAMCFESLAQQGVRPLSRDAAMVVDLSVRMRFRHRGGYATLESMPSVSSSPSSSRGGSPDAGSPGGAGSPAGGASPGGTARAAVSHAAPGPRPKYPPFNPGVHGVLYQLTEGDLATLAKREAGYVLREFEVETYDGRHVMAQAFVSSPLALLPGEVVPPEKYMRALREGAGDNFLDPLHQAWLSSVETVSSAGLGAEYFQTPLHYVGLGFLGVTALLVLAFFAQL